MVSLVGADVDADGTWSGFQAKDVLYVADADGIVDISGVNEGANLGGIGTIDVEDDMEGEVTMTAAQHTVLATAVAGAGAITGGDLTIDLTEVVDGVTGIAGVAEYMLFDDATTTESNTFTVAATDQAVTAGNQGDTLNANTGADTFTL